MFKILAGIVGLAVAWGLAVTTYAIFELGDRFGQLVDRFVSHMMIALDVFLGLLALAVVSLLGVFVYGKYDDRADNALRQRDGSYRLQKRKMRDGTEVMFDLTRTSSAGAAFHPDHGFVELPSPMGEDARARMFQAHMGRSAWQAAFAGDNALRDPEHQVKEPSITAAAAKALYPKEKKPINLAQPADTYAEAEAPTFSAAMAQGTISQIPIGYLPDGEMMIWEPDIDPHLRFHGKTRSGKTNAMVATVAMARQAGAHVVVSDRRNFRNWRSMMPSIETVNANNLAEFAGSIQALHAEFEERDLLIGRAGVDDFTQYTPALPRLVFAIGEFGATWRKMKDEYPASSVIERLLSELCQMAGATGINVMAEDQIPGEGIWPRELTANASPVVGKNDRNASFTGYNKPHELKPYTFAYDGEVYRTWDMTEPASVQALAGLPKLNGYRVVRKPSHGPSHGSGHPSNGPWNDWTPQDKAGPHQRESHDETKPGGGIGGDSSQNPRPTVLSHGEGYKEAIILWYRSVYGGTQAECLRWASIEGIDISRSYVYKVYADHSDSEGKS